MIDEFGTCCNQTVPHMADDCYFGNYYIIINSYSSISKTFWRHIDNSRHEGVMHRVCLNYNDLKECKLIFQLPRWRPSNYEAVSVLPNTLVWKLAQLAAGSAVSW